MPPRRICLTPQVSGVGGMVSFQHKLAAGLDQRGVQVSYDLADTPYDAVLVIGGTRRLGQLFQARRRGVPVVQRLDGMNWLHRLHLPGRPRPSVRHFLRAEAANWLLNTIRRRLATAVVYQSEFSRRWWERVHGPTPVPCQVIYNGVDLQVYSPGGNEQPPQDRFRLLLVEGSLMGGYEQGLEAAVALQARLAELLARSGEAGPVELMVVGRVAPEVQRRWSAHASDRLHIHWAGLVPRDQIPPLDRGAHLLYSSDVNAACPNSVIEALACGLPVVAFDTGALPELVTGEAGRVAPYGGNPWRLDPPDVPALAQAALEILHQQEHFRQAARASAEARFGLDRMVAQYLQVLG